MGGEKQILNPGDAVHIPANVSHSVKALDGKGIHNLMFYSPTAMIWAFRSKA